MRVDWTDAFLHHLVQLGPFVFDAATTLLLLARIVVIRRRGGSDSSIVRLLARE